MSRTILVPERPQHKSSSPRHRGNHQMSPTLSDIREYGVSATGSELSNSFQQLDDEFFDGARGDESALRRAAQNLSKEDAVECIVKMSRLLRTALHKTHDTSRSSSRVVLNVDEGPSRPISAMSCGAASLASAASRAPAANTTAVEKTVDEESGNKMINGYIMLSDLGRGSHAKVKLAFDTQRNQLRAIKVVRRPPITGARHQDRRRSMEQEIAIAKRIRHKNLIALIEIIDDPGSEKLYLVFQYAGGGCITKTRASFCDRFDVDRCAHFARHICAGISYLHRHQIVHRDIKPENILVGDDDSVLVTDFGISELLGADESSTESTGLDKALTVRGSRGTLAFLAPELLEGGQTEGQDETKTDIWALGVTLFMLLCGRLPWICEDLSVACDNPARFACQPRQYTQMVCSSQPPMFPPLNQLLIPAVKSTLSTAFQFTEMDCELPVMWIKLITDMLHKDPTKRPSLDTIRSVVKSFPTVKISSANHSLHSPSDGPTTPCEPPTLSASGNQSQPSLRGPLTSSDPSSSTKTLEGSTQSHQRPNTPEDQRHLQEMCEKLFPNAKLDQLDNFESNPIQEFTPPVSPGTRRRIRSWTEEELHISLKAVDT